MSKDVENLRKHERVLNHVDIIKDKLEHKNKIKVGLLEFHPYDCCPLSCLYCTYHRDKSAVFPFESMEKLKIFGSISKYFFIVEIPSFVLSISKSFSFERNWQLAELRLVSVSARRILTINTTSSKCKYKKFKNSIS